MEDMAMTDEATGDEAMEKEITYQEGCEARQRPASTMAGDKGLNPRPAPRPAPRPPRPRPRSGP